MATSSRPSNYFNLKPGAEFIVLDGKAVPIAGIVGGRTTNFFYPNFGQTGYRIQKREMTAKEQAQASKAAAAYAPRPAVAGGVFDDWR